MDYGQDYASFATELMRKLEDRGGKLAHVYYREYALTYPRSFLEATLYYVLSVPEEIVTVSKSELFKIILGMTHVEDMED